MCSYTLTEMFKGVVSMDIVKIKPQDAQKFLNLLLQLDKETKFMMFEPDERKMSAEQLENLLGSGEESGIFSGIQKGNEIVGFISVKRGIPNRMKHTAYIATGILQEYVGKGLGKKLIKEAEKWALKYGVTRLELTVNEKNERAIALYEKMGFHKEGLKEHAMKIDGEYVNEYYMSKFL